MGIQVPLKRGKKNREENQVNEQIFHREIFKKKDSAIFFHVRRKVIQSRQGRAFCKNEEKLLQTTCVFFSPL